MKPQTIKALCVNDYNNINVLSVNDNNFPVLVPHHVQHGWFGPTRARGYISGTRALHLVSEAIAAYDFPTTTGAKSDPASLGSGQPESPRSNLGRKLGFVHPTVMGKSGNNTHRM